MIIPLLVALTSVAPAPSLEVPVDAPAASFQTPDWIELYGDMRVGAEFTKAQNDDGDERTRGRLRFRAGAKFSISADMKAEVRMTTSTGDANSVHWDFGGGSDSSNGAEMAIDRINLTWAAADHVSVKVGKFGNPFKTNPVNGEWTWDGDIQPAGIFAQWSSEGEIDMDLRFGYFILDEVNDTDDNDTADPAVTSVQLNLSGGGDLGWGFSTMMSDWSSDDAFHFDPGPPATGQDEDFLIWDSVASIKSGDLVGSLQFVQNLDDDSGDDTGFALGFKYGSSGHAGDQRFFGSYFDFDTNAFVSAMAQDDTPLPGTGGGIDGGMDGFLAGWQYWLRDDVSLKLWGLQADNGTDAPLRLRFDIDINLSR